MKKVIILLFVVTVLLTACQPSGLNSDNTTKDTAFQGASNPTDAPSTAPATSPVPVEPAPLHEELEQEIIDKYTALHVQDSEADASVELEYFGTYDGCVVAFIHLSGYDYLAMEDHVSTGGLVFWYGSSQRLTVYRDGSFLSLDDAYLAGWLTDDGLAQLHAWYKSVHSFAYEDME